MDYAYKITTHGRAVLATCLDLRKPLRLTRAAVGGGLIDKDEDLAKVHALVRYAAEASITDRRHEEDRLFLTVRYSNQDHPEAGAFTLSEFMVWAEDPETGQETDFLYAALGDYRQPVPAHSEAFPASTWSYPLVLVVSGELEVSITASPGLARWDDLLEVRDELIRSIMMNELRLPLTTTKGEPILTTGGTPILAVYRPNRSASILAAMEALDGRLSGQIAQARADLTARADEKGRTALSSANAYTDGKVLGLERRMEADAGSVAWQIATAMTAAIDAAERNTTVKVGKAMDDLTDIIGQEIAVHNTAAAAHPTHLSTVKKS